MDKILYGWFLPLTLAFTFALVAYIFLRDNVCVVEGNGMNPSFLNGETVAVKKSNNIEINDILLIDNPLKKKNQEHNFTLKRCVALPGDSLEINAKLLYVNGQLNSCKHCQYNRKFNFFNKSEVKAAVNDYGILSGKITNMIQVVPLTDELFSKIISDGKIKHVVTDITSKDLSDRCLYPFSSFFRWNKDFYGPILVPKKGTTIAMNTRNFVFYKYMIEHFENSKLEYKDGKFLVNGQVAENYTFKNDYYFLLNDTRDDPSDSRTFGPVPASLIFGKCCGYLIGKDSKGEIDYKKSFVFNFGDL